MMKATKRLKVIKRLLFEAYRRNEMNDAHEQQKPILQRWLGLGTAAAYRPVLDAGLMVFHDGETPPPRCMGWLCLTPAGLQELEKLTREFAAVLAKAKRRGYDKTMVANYMLLGGISKR